jgi:hypothetical protein
MNSAWFPGNRSLSTSENRTEISALSFIETKKFNKLLVAMQLKKLVISHDLPSNQTYLRRQ